jgi:hypothetical protein
MEILYDVGTKMIEKDFALGFIRARISYSVGSSLRLNPIWDSVDYELFPPLKAGMKFVGSGSACGVVWKTSLRLPHGHERRYRLPIRLDDEQEHVSDI